MAVPNAFNDFKIGRFEQSAFGTGAVAASAIRFLEVEPVSLPVAPNIVVGNAASASRYKDELHISTNTNMLAPEFAITGLADTTELAHQLYSWFQNVSNSTGDLTFTLGATQPDFAADGGYFASYVFNTATASTHRSIDDVISKELTLSCAPGEYLKFNSSLIGRGATNNVFNSTGTWTRGTPSYLHYADMGEFKFDFGAGEVAVVLVGPWEMKFSHDVVPFGQVGGEYYSYLINNRKMTFTASILWDVNARSAETDFIAGNTTEGVISWGTDGTATGDLFIDFHGYFTKCEIPTDSPAMMNIEVEMIGRETATAIAPVTILMDYGADPSW